MKDPNGRYRPASIIKALLALVVIEELPLAQAAEAYAAMDSGRARYRMVLTT